MQSVSKLYIQTLREGRQYWYGPYANRKAWLKLLTEWDRRDIKIHETDSSIAEVQKCFIGRNLTVQQLV